MREWQKRFIRAIYTPHARNEKGQVLRRVRRAILSIARKNGKTALIAALVLVHLVGPEAVPNGEIYSAANDREQAAQVFKVARQIIEAEPELASLIKPIPSTKTLVCYSNGSVYRALSAEAGTKHGLNPTFVIFDELAQARNRDLYDVLDTSFGARAEPLFVVISTQSNDPQHILSQLIDDGLSGVDPTIVCHLYEVTLDCPDIFDPKVWRRANPALGDFRSLADLKAIADKAQRMPAEEPKFRNLYLNQRVAPVASLIARAEWAACKGAAAFADGEPVYLALDMAAVVDLAALVMGSDGATTRVAAHFWKPGDLLVEHSRRDFGSGHQQYVLWRDAGHLEAHDGRSIDAAAVALRIAELCGRYDVRGLAYDRWRMDVLRRELDRVGLETHLDGEPGGGLRLIPWGQGFKDMAPAVDALEAGVLNRTLEQPGHPVLTWNVANAVVTTDPAGNRKIDKAKARFRIDGAVALAMLLGLKARDRMDPTFDADDWIASYA
ncbi:terminase large subunit [Methylobacterium sp. NEAU 140]|uniref:terminase large subunit n=1 Tax=Methylobacterium sp. NEAU 140 TaxID=3064945 RepID=UPI002734CD59|nr:terminase TerL endonuclease subunit [Methylobacterium sp. NEAU 140]MDP4024450.1 terminase large subunit [Methylobacterium sp. NEAU 140]